MNRWIPVLLVAAVPIGQIAAAARTRPRTPVQRLRRRARRQLAEVTDSVQDAIGTIHLPRAARRIAR